MLKYQITAVGIYGLMLVLQPMQGNSEGTASFGPFQSREELLAFYNSHKVEPYSDEGVDTFNGGTKSYRKSFRQGSPLEWMNPLEESEMEKPGIWGHGIHEVLIDVQNIQKQFPFF